MENLLSIHDISILHLNKEWRPTVVIVLFNSSATKVYVGRQDSLEQNWSLFQGGIEDGENVADAARRELRQAGFAPESVKIEYPYLLNAFLRFPEGSSDALGFREGMVYACVGARLLAESANPALEAGRKLGTLGGAWLSPEEACRYCVVQPAVSNAAPATREKGWKVAVPAIRTMLDRLYALQIHTGPAR